MEPSPTSCQSLFGQGISFFKSGKYDQSIQCFNEAVGLANAWKTNASQGPPLFLLYDSRAAAHLKTRNIASALSDAKRVIELAPERWQGYSRAAKGFLHCKKFQKARIMLEKAREKVVTGDEGHTKRIAGLDALEREITEAEQRAALLRVDLDVKKSIHDDAGFAMPYASPFAKLPWELTVTIFLETVAIHCHDDPGFIIPSTTDIFTLTGVSRSWRTIALNAPSLWRRLVLTKAHPEKKARAWIQRSKGRIRELVFRHSFLKTAETSRFADKANSLEHYILERVLKGIKWETLRVFTVENWAKPQMLYDGAMSRMLGNLEILQVLNNGTHGQPFGLWDPVLRELGIGGSSAISGRTETTPDDDSRHTEAIDEQRSSCSPLRHLVLEWCKLSLSTLVESNFKNLVSLKLRSILVTGEANILNVLGLCSYLEVLELDIGDHIPAISSLPSFPAPMVLPHLSSIYLSGPVDVCGLFNAVDTPNLRILKIGHNAAPLTPVFRQLAQREASRDRSLDERRDMDGASTNNAENSRLGLQELRLSFCNFEPAGLVQLLGVSPSLRVLEVSRYGSEINQVLEALVVDPDSNQVILGADSKSICPALRELDVSHSPQVSTGPIVRLVKSRLDKSWAPACRPVASIERLKMDGCPRIEHTALPWLRANVKVLSCIYADRKTAGYRR